MENIIEINEQNIVNLEEYKDPKTIFSVLFKDYQLLEIEKDPTNEAVNNEKNKNSINNLKIRNDDDFSRAINEKLEEIKQNTLSRLNKSIDRYKICYKQYQNIMLNFIEKKGNDLSKVINNDFKNDVILKYVINNIFDKINNLIEIHDNILNNIEKNFCLLNDTLEKIDLINQKKPIIHFLNHYYKNILNCSLINKFNFKKINNSHITLNNYYKNYFNFLKEEKNNEVIKTFTLKKEKIKSGIQYIKDNFPSIENLNMNGIDRNDLEKIVDSILTFSNKKINPFILKKIKIKDFDFSEKSLSSLEERASIGNRRESIASQEKNIRGSIKLKNIELKKIEKMAVSVGQYLNISLLYDLFLNNTECLKSLVLEKVNLNNIGFKTLMNIFKLKPNLLETLEYLSLSGNSISAVKDDIFQLKEMQKKTFKKLKIFNLNKNCIYKFEISLERMPELKLLDLSSNNILTGTTMENMIKSKGKLILFNDNIFITNNYKNNNKYIDYLNNQLPNLDFGVKVLHLGFTYDKEKQYLLEKLTISPSMKISLIKLDLSFCGLTTDILVKFLKKNFGLFSLKNLKLKYNNIDSSIFEKLLSDDILMEKLNIIDLSENEIKCQKFEESFALVKFIEKNQNLEQIKFMNSFFIDNWTTNIAPDLDIDEKFKKLYLELNKKLKLENRNFIFIIDSDNWSYVDNEFQELFSFRSV